MIDESMEFLDDLLTKIVVNPVKRRLERNPETKVWRLYAFFETVLLIVGVLIFFTFFIPITIVMLSVTFFAQSHTEVGIARQRIFDDIERDRTNLKLAVTNIEKEKNNGLHTE